GCERADLRRLVVERRRRRIERRAYRRPQAVAVASRDLVRERDLLDFPDAVFDDVAVLVDAANEARAAAVAAEHRDDAPARLRAFRVRGQRDDGRKRDVRIDAAVREPDGALPDLLDEQLADLLLAHVALH